MKKRNERGAIGGVEGLAFAVLIFVFGTLFVANAWATVDAKLASSAAAREAARAYVESNSTTEGSDSARAAADNAMQGHGRQVADVTISSSSSFERCGVVEIAVSAAVPRVSLPLLGRGGGTTNVTSRHSEVVDPYRSGLAGEADC